MLRFRVRTVWFSFLVAALLVIGTAVSGAPAPKGTGGGTIYFINGTAGSGGSINYTWSMESDGSNITQLGNWCRFNYPSRILHNGYRWFLSVRPVAGSYPDGTQRGELFAFRDDYPASSDTVVQLTNDDTLQLRGCCFYAMQWLPGDESISFRARRWSGDEVTEGGLYTVDLLYDENDNIIGLAAPPTIPALPFPLDGDEWPTFTDHSWDPTGGLVVYYDYGVSGLWVADLADGTCTQIVEGAATSPDWSPDGSKILFKMGASIYTIKPTGRGLKEVITSAYVQGVYWGSFSHPSFSPGARTPPPRGSRDRRRPASGPSRRRPPRIPSFRGSGARDARMRTAATGCRPTSAASLPSSR